MTSVGPPGTVPAGTSSGSSAADAKGANGGQGGQQQQQRRRSTLGMGRKSVVVQRVEELLGVEEGQEGEADIFVKDVEASTAAASGAGQRETAGVADVLGLLLYCALAMVIFIAIFSGMGKGADVYQELSDQYDLWKVAFGTGFVLLLLLYILDGSFWDMGLLLFVRNVMLCVGAACICVGIILSMKEYPAAPQALYMLSLPVGLYLIKSSAYKSLSTAAFLSSLSYACTICGTVCFIVFVVWAQMADRNWNDDTRELYKSQMSCDVCVGSSVSETCADALRESFYDAAATVGELRATCTLGKSDGGCGGEWQEYCLAAYLLWITPFIASCASFFFGFVCYFLSQSLQKKGGQRIHSTLKMFVFIIMILLVGIWVGAEIAGSEMELGNVVQIFAGTGLFIVGAIVCTTIGWKAVQTSLMSIPLMRKIEQSFLSDWMKAMFCICCMVPYFLFLALSSVNQFFRAYLMSRFFSMEDEEIRRGGWLTEVAATQVAGMATWRWSSIMTKVMWLGIIYISIVVGVGKLTSLFLSWLIDELAGLDLIVVYLIFCVVGLIMFLLPPVPGVPVYLTGGIIMTAAGEDSFGSFFGALFVSSLICFGIKLIAIVMQQKGIGENLGKMVYIRQLVGINSVTMQAIRKILEQPGLNLPKVCILVGGPDWPTSVITGILGLNLFEMLLGSLPVMFLIIPTAMAGGFQLKKAEGGIWESAASVTLAIAALVQGAGLIAALYYIEQVATTHHEELSKLPKDEDVLKADEVSEKVQAVYHDVTKWQTLPALLKATLVAGVSSMVLSCYIIQFYSEICFETFEITDKIDCPETAEELEAASYNCLDGSALNLVKPMGWFCVGTFACSCALLTIFIKWGTARAKSVIGSATSAA
mmetsp:Transcript_8424/g.27972  ORF Transcript_8424/g.27972 Transcript_8424/m.27972 type:complete len:876 (+) Transcript_8424:337-2964(+)